MKRLSKNFLSAGLIAGASVTLAGTLSGCVAFVPLIEPDYQPKQGLFGPVATETCPVTGEQLSAQPASQDSASWMGRTRKTPTQNLDIDEAEAFVAAHVPSKPRARADKRKVKLSKLIRQLKADTAVARTHAASDIGFMGPYAVHAVGPLAFALRHDDSKWVRRAAAKSLGKIGSEEVVAPLRRALNDRNKWVAHSAGNALRRVERKLGYSRQQLRRTRPNGSYSRPDFQRPGSAPTFKARGNKVQKL